VILAPHLTHVPKHLLGLPHWDAATPLQRRDGMCYKSEGELYNGGSAFKLCARDERGVVVTLIADNYFGYCKKEVKTQISYSANLFGRRRRAFRRRAGVSELQRGQEYTDLTAGDDYSLQEVLERDPERFVLQLAGHAIDRLQRNVVLVPAKSTFSLRSQTVSWPGRWRDLVDQVAGRQDLYGPERLPDADGVRRVPIVGSGTSSEPRRK
jgi:hypothetical protein